MVSRLERKQNFKEKHFKEQHINKLFILTKEDHYCLPVNKKMAQLQCNPKEDEKCNVNVDIDEEHLKEVPNITLSIITEE